MQLVRSLLTLKPRTSTLLQHADSGPISPRTLHSFGSPSPHHHHADQRPPPVAFVHRPGHRSAGRSRRHPNRPSPRRFEPYNLKQCPRYRCNRPLRAAPCKQTKEEILPVSLANEDAAGRARATSQQEDVVCARTTAPLEDNRLPITTSCAAAASGLPALPSTTGTGTSNGTRKATRRPIHPHRPPFADALSTPCARRTTAQDLICSVVAFAVSFVQAGQPAHVLSPAATLSNCNGRTSPSLTRLFQRDTRFPNHDRHTVTHHAALRLFPFSFLF